MFRMMFADVVSVARPGSSDGGSAPIDSRSTWVFAPVAPIAEPATAMAMSAAAPAHHAHLLLFRIPSLLEDFTCRATFSASTGEEDRGS
jgi:hypothetical protein